MSRVPTSSRFLIRLKQHCQDACRKSSRSFGRPQNNKSNNKQIASASLASLWSGLAVAILSVVLSEMGAWELLEQQSYNRMHQANRAIAGEPSWDDRVVVIAIDEASVTQFGWFPWSRDHYVDLLARLQGAQPAAIAFDILLPDATDQDAQFAEMISNTANVVLAVGTNSAGDYLNVSPSIAERVEGLFLRGDVSNHPDVDGVTRILPVYSQSAASSFSLATLHTYSESMASTAQATASTVQAVTSNSHPAGSHSFGSKSFGSKSFDRHSSDNKSFGSKFESSKTLDSELMAPVSEGAVPGATLKVFSSASLKDEALWIRWPGEISPIVDPLASHQPLELASPRTLKTYSYADVVDGRIESGLFQNKIVLVGSTLAGVDSMRTPFDQNPPVGGVYLYAATLNNLLNQSFLRQPPAWQRLLLLTILALASSYLLRRQGIYWRLIAVMSFSLLWCVLALGAFVSGWWIPVVAPIGTLFLSASAIQLYEQREKQQLMALFSMNVSPGTAELIWRHKGAILHKGELAAQTLTATVLFMDIRGFTTIAETLPSQQLLPWLNQYFETMTDCIMKHGGMVDKYIGDAIMAVFGAPVPRSHPDEIQADAIAALHAALEMHERLRSLNQKLAAQNLPLIKFGIGIHTGPLIGGTVGNRQRLSYSLFGDTVNVAARLESMTKNLPEEAPFKLLLSADTRQHTQDYFPVELFQSGQLRGRAGHTDAYMVAKPATLVPLAKGNRKGGVPTSSRHAETPPLVPLLKGNQAPRSNQATNG